MHDDPLREWDALGTARAIRAGEVSAVEVVEAAIDRAAQAQPVLHALVESTPGRARAAAATIDRRRARGDQLPVLAGVPSAVKDLSDQAGVPTRQGSRAIRDHVPQVNGVEVDEFLSSGLVSIGKSSTPEFGFVPTTEPLFGDPTRNPWSLEHSSGGSSGGAAALVAAGVVPIAHATDGGGSIRIPAAITGVVGLKPTVDRHRRMDKMARLPIKVSVSNVVTRTVADTAAHMAALERHHRNTRMPPVGSVRGPADRRVRVGVVLDGPNASTAPPIRAAVQRTADLLADLGHDVAAIPWSVGEQFTRDFVLYWGTLAMVTVPYLRRQLRGRFDRDLLDPFTATLAQHARTNLPRIPPAVRRLRRTIGTYEALFEDVDVVLSPTLARLTPVIGATAPTRVFDDLIGWLTDYVQFTPLHNVTGAPAMSLPAGQHLGLPLGIQLATLPGDDRTLLEIAYEVEAAAPWPLLAPWPPASSESAVPSSR